MNFHGENVVSDQAVIVRFCWKTVLKFAARIVPDYGTTGRTGVGKLAKCPDIRQRGPRFNKTRGILHTCCCNVCPMGLVQEIIK